MRRISTSMHAYPQQRFGGLSIIEWYRLPFRERVADRLADLMFEAEDLLDMLKAEDQRRDFRRLASDIRQVYENVNTLMKSICD